MKNIKDIIFTRFKSVKTLDGIIVEEAKKSIKRVLNINIPDSYYEIVFHKPNLVIKSSVSVLKNEIFINKEKIIEEIRNKTNKNTQIKILLK